MKTSCKRIRPRFHPALAAAVTTLLLAIHPAARSPAYVMPPEQLADRMQANFSKIKTLIITQKTHLKNMGEEEKGEKELIWKERLWIKPPGLYRAEQLPTEKDRDAPPSVIPDREPGGDMVFRLLFLLRDQSKVLSFLSRLGIDVDQVAFSRFEETVVYCLGDMHPESPKLLIEKDTFLPLFLCYRTDRHAGSGPVRVRFKDYQRLKAGWYPFEIEYVTGKGVTEVFSILDIAVNRSFDQPLAEITVPGLRPHTIPVKKRDTQKDKRLQDIIELLKEKY